MILQRRLRIDVERRAEFFGERVHAHTFAKQIFPDVTEAMHKGGILVSAGESSRLVKAKNPPENSGGF
jgi:hypothetical protein